MAIDNGGGNGAGPAAESGPMTFSRMTGEAEPLPEKEVPGDEAEGDEGEESEEEADDTEEEAETEEESDDSSDDSGESESEDDEDASDSDKEGDSDADTEESEEEKETPEKDLEEVSKSAKGKTVTLKAGGKEYQIPADAKITIEKNGAPVTVTLKEAANNIVTAREIDQQFTKLDREKKVFDRERRDLQKIQIMYADLEDQVDLIRHAAQEGNLYEVAQATLNVFSNGKQDVAQKLFGQIMSLTEEVSNMTEDQLKHAVTNSQLKFTNRKLERDKKKTESQLTRENQRQWLGAIINKAGISWDEYVERYEALKEVNAARKNNGQPLTLRDDMTFEDIASEVVKFTYASRNFNRANNIMDRLKITPEQRKVLTDEVFDLTAKGFSDEDIEDILRRATGRRAVKKVSLTKDSSKEVSKSSGKPSKGTAKQEAKPQKAAAAKETKKDNGGGDDGPVTFGKLINKYADQ